MVTSLLLVVVCVSAVVKTINKYNYRQKKKLALIGLLIGVISVSFITEQILSAIGNRNFVKDQLEQMVSTARSYAQGEYIYVFSTSVYPSFPLITYSETKWASRFSHLWLLPTLVNQEGCLDGSFICFSGMCCENLRQSLFDAVISDMDKYKPSIVFVQLSNLQAIRKERFDLIDYFSQDQRFVDVWADYSLFSPEEISGHKVFIRRKGH